MKDIWTTGIKVEHGVEGWIASCEWQSGEFAQSGYMEGEIATRYYEPTMGMAIDYVLDAIEIMNVKRSNEIDIMKEEIGFTLYREEVEEVSDYIIEQIKNEAKLRGWLSY